MKLVFDDQAIADLEDIHRWIAQDSPTAATNVVEALQQHRVADFIPIHGASRYACLELSSGLCRACPTSWCTKLTGREERVVVTAVFHGAQDREGGEP